MKEKANSDGTDALRDVAALRHSFHIDGRLRLEFLSLVSKLLRDHQVPISNQVLNELIVALPDELSQEGQMAVVEDTRLAYAAKKIQPGARRPPAPPKPPVPPVPPKAPVPPKPPVPPVPPVPPKKKR